MIAGLMAIVAALTVFSGVCADNVGHPGTMGYEYEKTLQKQSKSKRHYNLKSAKLNTHRANSIMDLSEWQGSLTANQVKLLKARYKFIILRVQYGSNYKDRVFQHNAALMDKYGMPYGVYSFSRYVSVADARQEAKDLYHRAPRASFYINDFEANSVKYGSSDNATLAWYQQMKSMTSKKVLFYSYQYFMNTYAPSASRKYDGRWIAAYTVSEPSPSHVLWQYTDHYHSPELGQNVDASVMASGVSSSWFVAPKAASHQNTATKPAAQTNNGTAYSLTVKPKAQSPAKAKAKTAVRHGFGKVVSVKSSNFNLWGNWNFSKKKGSTKDYYGKNLLAKTYYKVGNRTYYSVYDQNGKWLGFVNASAVVIEKPIAQKKMISLKSKGYQFWGNLMFTQKKNNSDYYMNANRNLQVRRYYITGNGSRYYSVYDNHGKWQGYVDASATQDIRARRTWKYVRVNGRHRLWRNFFWKTKQTVRNRSYFVKYTYDMGNGKHYLSLYSRNGRWQGYVNEQFTR